MSCDSYKAEAFFIYVCCVIFFLKNEMATSSLYMENDRCFGLEGENSCRK
jgi:hypothetical protein